MILLPRVMKKQTVLCFSFSSIDTHTLVTYKLQQREFIGAVIPIKQRILFPSTLNLPPHTHFHNFLFVITGKGNCECFTCCPGFSAARLNLVNQKVKIKSEWKLREKQPSNDRDTRQWRMMLLLQGSSSSTQGLGITIWLCKRISLILQK